MKVTILGSGCSYINLDKKGAAFLLEFDGKYLLFDCGWGCQESLLRIGIPVQKLDHVFITHPHADHIGGLIPLLQSIYVSGLFYPKTKRTKPLYLHGYKGFSKDYEALRTIMFPERIEPYEIHVLEYYNETRNFDSFKVHSSEVVHNPRYFHSNAYRIDFGNKSFVYSGDMGYDEKFIALSKDADIALLEMSFWPAYFKEFGARPNHLSTFECGLIAKKAKIKKLVLVHTYDKATDKEIESEIRKNFEGELIISKDLLNITF